MEEWKDIFFEENGIIYDYHGLYQVSNLGRVKSLERLDSKGRKVKERILKTRYDSQGYLLVDLYKNGKRKTFRIHRLVALVFLINDEPLIKTEVNHKDENKENNCVSNLEWCTREYNNNYGTRNERASENYPKKKAVIGINVKNPSLTVEYPSMRQAEKDGFNNGNICSCCKGNQKYHKGYYWMYYDKYLKMIEENILF